MATFLNNLIRNRFFLLIFLNVVFVTFHYLASGQLLPSTETKDLWFYSGLFMVLFSILFIEPYYTSPKNVITNVIPLILVFFSIYQSFPYKSLWYLIISILIILLVLAIVPLLIVDENNSPVTLRNRIAEFLKNLVLIFGKGKTLYSAIFLIFLYINISSSSENTFTYTNGWYFIFLFLFWWIILTINPAELNNTFSVKRKSIDRNAIGEIFGVQSRKMFLVKMYEDRINVRKFDIVKFKYSMQDEDSFIAGMIFDTYLLNKEKWIKVLQLSSLPRNGNKLEKNIVYKVVDDETAKLESSLKVNEFVGIVTERSTIGKIKFEYSKKTEDLQEGELLELKIGDRRVFYQVVNGSTNIELLEAKNSNGFIEGEAVQLGEWQAENLCFHKYGWLPSINTPIFRANTDNIVLSDIKYPDFQLGVIPKTSLPSVINLKEAISHHLALLGVTGSGKSFIARELIRTLMIDTSIICVDFTGEWKKEIEGHNLETEILTKDNIVQFLNNSASKVGIVELPSLSNTTDVLKATENLFEMVFNYAKSKYSEDSVRQIALVLEEAHTITPETSFLGDMGDYGSSKALVNKMGQVALQGRKYGVGLIVIAQRTANVSKTVLTQCNTVICFQAFDETSFNFLGNYIGKEMVETLPNLKKYHAIVTGKAVRSNIPMIIDLERKEKK